MSAPFAATTRLLAPTRTRVTTGPHSIAEVLRRHELSRRQADRRRKLRSQKEKADYERDLRHETQQLNRVTSNLVKEARRVRREDYELGPLAPRRDVGQDEFSYGAVDSQLTHAIKVPKWKQKWCPFKAGDRVVVLQGYDKGKISVVVEIAEDTQTLQVKHLNLVEVPEPEWVRKIQNSDRAVRSSAQPIPFDAVRLVFPLAHPVTGELRDVIVENLERRVDWIDEQTGETHYKRVIPELDDYEVPWPNEEEPSYVDHAEDTLRIHVEQETFAGQAIPLLGLPMPASVIDELRNKHSKTGKIRDLDYIEKIQQREEAKRQKDLRMLAEMRTPLQELHALRKEQKKQQPGAAAEPEEPSKFHETYLDIQKDKPWVQRVSLDARKAWKQAWAEEQEAAKREGRPAKKPSKNAVKHEPLDTSFLEQLGEMMEQKGLDGSKKAANRIAAS